MQTKMKTIVIAILSLGAMVAASAQTPNLPEQTAYQAPALPTGQWHTLRLDNLPNTPAGWVIVDMMPILIPVPSSWIRAPSRFISKNALSELTQDHTGHFVSSHDLAQASDVRPPASRPVEGRSRTSYHPAQSPVIALHFVDEAAGSSGALSEKRLGFTRRTDEGAKGSFPGISRCRGPRRTQYPGVRPATKSAAI